jgi:arginyl-tRNA synthetase
MRKLSIEYLTEFYKKMGICFDVWDSESYYVADARRISNEIVDMGLTTTNNEGLELLHNTEHGGYSVVCKSNNYSSLYQTR